MARSLPTPEVHHYRVQDFSGGLNVKSDPGVLGDNESSDLMNVVFSGKGTFEKRPAVRIIDEFTNEPNILKVSAPLQPEPNSEEVTQLFVFSKRDGRKLRIKFFRYLDVSGESYIRSAEIYAEDKEPKTTLLNFFKKVEGNTFLSEHILSKNQWSIFTHNDIMYIINEVEGLFKLVEEDAEYGPHFIAVQGSVPKAKYAISRKQRVFFAGIPGESDRLYFTQLNNPESTDNILYDDGEINYDKSGGIYDIQSNDTEITGLGIFLDALVIFKENSVYTLTGTNPNKDFSLKTINVSDGCINYKTIQKGNNFLYYLSKSGFQYLYSPHQESIQVGSLSEQIDPELEQMDYSKAHSVFFRSNYYLFTDLGTYIFDETLKSWTKWDVVMNTAFVEAQKERIILGGNCKHVYTFVTGVYDDLYHYDWETPIRAYYSTRYFDLGEPELRKRMKFLKLFYKPADGNGEFTLTQEINYRDQSRIVDTSYTSLFWGEFNWSTNWGAPAAMATKKVTIGGQGEFVRYRFYNDKPGQNLKIYGFVIGYKRKKKVR